MRIKKYEFNQKRLKKNTEEKETSFNVKDIKLQLSKYFPELSLLEKGSASVQDAIECKFIIANFVDYILGELIDGAHNIRADNMADVVQYMPFKPFRWIQV